jgi:hypothetical protein
MRADLDVAELARISTIDYGYCRDCGKPIMWRWNDNPTPKKMIINRDPDPQGRIVPKMDGTVHVLTNAEEALLSSDVTRYTDHHVTCPHADKWRKKR